MTTKKELNFNWRICGHEKIVHFLQSAIINSKVSNAYLFVGPKHTGKYTVAREFVASLFCVGASGSRPCGECYHCRQFKSGMHPDVNIIERPINVKTDKLRKDIIIDQIRELKSRLQQATLLNSYKAVIIPEAQLINSAAANAFLKILEEPTANTVVILIADDIQSLPKTIVSRCQTIKFLPVGVSKIEKFLAASGVADAKIIALQAHGNPGIALLLAHDNKEYLKDLAKNNNSFFQVLDADSGARLALVDDLLEWDSDEAVNTIKLNRLLDNWQSLIRDMMLFRNGNEALISAVACLTQIAQRPEDFTFYRISRALLGIRQAKDYLKQNISSKTALENLIINL